MQNNISSCNLSYFPTNCEFHNFYLTRISKENPYYICIGGAPWWEESNEKINWIWKKWTRVIFPLTSSVASTTNASCEVQGIIKLDKKYCINHAKDDHMCKPILTRTTFFYFIKIIWLVLEKRPLICYRFSPILGGCSLELFFLKEQFLRWQNSNQQSFSMPAPSFDSYSYAMVQQMLFCSINMRSTESQANFLPSPLTFIKNVYIPKGENKELSNVFRPLRHCQIRNTEFHNLIGEEGEEGEGNRSYISELLSPKMKKKTKHKAPAAKATVYQKTHPISIKISIYYVSLFFSSSYNCNLFFHT